MIRHQANGANPYRLMTLRAWRTTITAMMKAATKPTPIAKPSSTLRVWAEPETGGEAYIPLASSKRARSTAILDDVASQFGYDLVRKAEMYANGGIRGGESARGDTHVHVDASPGVAYMYANEVATATATRLRDAQVLYDVA